MDERLPSLPRTEIGSIANPLSLLAGNYSHVVVEYDLYLDEDVDLVSAVESRAECRIIHALTSTQEVEVLLTTTMEDRMGR
jgi:hypothetical protein